MLTQKDVQGILKKDEKEKTALLKNILESFRNAETALKKKKGSAEELEKKSQAAEEMIKDLLNERIQRLETENVEFQAKIETIQKDFTQIDELNEKAVRLSDELEQAGVLAENIMKERDEAQMKLSKIQEQWQKFSSGA